MNAVGEFFAMGGYALYVWTSYGLALLLLGAVAVYAVLELSRTRRQTFARALARKVTREVTREAGKGTMAPATAREGT